MDDLAIAVGEKGLVRLSHDGGATWVPPRPSEFPSIFTFMRDLDFTPDGNLGLIVGQSGRIYRSRDRGRSWEQVAPPEQRRVGG